MHNKANISKQTQPTVHSSPGLSSPNTTGNYNATNCCHPYQLPKPATEPVPKQDTPPRPIISNGTHISDNLPQHQITTFFKPRVQESYMYKDNPCTPTTYRDIDPVIITNDSDDSSSSTSTLAPIHDPLHDVPPHPPHVA